MLEVVRYDGPDGAEQARVGVRAASIGRHLVGRMETANVRLLPEAWEALADGLDELGDALAVEKDGSELFRGRYDMDFLERGRIVLQIVSPELDAVRAEPTGADIVYQNVPDTDIVGDIIDGDVGVGLPGVDAVDTGTLEQLEATLSMSFNHAGAAQSVREVAESTGGFVRYNADWTVDYVDRRGSDRTGEISSDARTLLGSPQVNRTSREGPVTHLRGFGAQSGPDQLTYTAVADEYEPGDPVNWKRYENKDIVQQDRLERTVDELLVGINDAPEPVTVEAVVDEALEPGDRIKVVVPDHNIDEQLHVHDVAHVFDGQGPERYEVTFSSRPRPEEDDEIALERDIGRFNRGYQGNMEMLQDTSGWDNAGDGHVQAMTVYDWPDNIEVERMVDLHVEARAWRSPIDISEHTHTVSIPDHNHSFSVPSHTHDVSISDTSEQEDFVGSFSSNTHDEGTHSGSFNETYSVDANSVIRVDLSFTVGTDDLVSVTIDINNDTVYSVGFTKESGDVISASHGIRRDDHSGSIPVDISMNVGGGSVENIEGLVVSVEEMPAHTHNVSDSTTSDSGGFHSDTTADGGSTTETSSSEQAGDAKIVTSFDGETFYPSNVDIKLNGTVVSTLSGDSNNAWDETVDLRGELGPGDVDIEADPQDGRGELMLTFRSEVFRRGRG